MMVSALGGAYWPAVPGPEPRRLVLEGTGVCVLLRWLLAWGVLRVSQAQSSSAGTEERTSSQGAAVSLAGVSGLFTTRSGRSDLPSSAPCLSTREDARGGDRDTRCRVPAALPTLLPAQGNGKGGD